jgi:hypothetical protein
MEFTREFLQEKVTLFNQEFKGLELNLSPKGYGYLIEELKEYLKRNEYSIQDLFEKNTKKYDFFLRKIEELYSVAYGIYIHVLLPKTKDTMAIEIAMGFHSDEESNEIASSDSFYKVNEIYYSLKQTLLTILFDYQMKFLEKEDSNKGCLPFVVLIVVGIIAFLIASR